MKTDWNFVLSACYVSVMNCTMLSFLIVFFVNNVFLFPVSFLSTHSYSCADHAWLLKIKK